MKRKRKKKKKKEKRKRKRKRKRKYIYPGDEKLEKFYIFYPGVVVVVGAMRESPYRAEREARAVRAGEEVQVEHTCQIDPVC